jgi:hypothetical protein
MHRHMLPYVSCQPVMSPTDKPARRLQR